MFFRKKMTSFFRNRRESNRLGWIQKGMTQKLALDDSQQQSLIIIVEKMEDSKQRLNNSFIVEDKPGFLADDQLLREQNKAELLTSIQQELSGNLDLIADFYDGLQDNQKDKFRQLLLSRHRYGSCCG